MCHSSMARLCLFLLLLLFILFDCRFILLDICVLCLNLCICAVFVYQFYHATLLLITQSFLYLIDGIFSLLLVLLLFFMCFFFFLMLYCSFSTSMQRCDSVTVSQTNIIHHVWIQKVHFTQQFIHNVYGITEYHTNGRRKYSHAVSITKYGRNKHKTKRTTKMYRHNVTEGKSNKTI